MRTEVLEIERTRHSTDGRLVSVTFATTGPPLELVASTGAMGSMLQQMSAVVADARRAQPQISSQIIAAPVPAKCNATITSDRKYIILRFEMKNGMAFEFGEAVFGRSSACTLP